MVGYAAERLQADDVADALPGQCGDLSGNQPSLAELRAERDSAACQFRFVEDVVERNEIAEPAAVRIDPLQLFLNLFVEEVDDELRKESVSRMVFLPVFRIHEALQEKVGQCRIYHLYPLRHQPVCDMPLCEGMEFQEYLAYDSHFRVVLVAAYPVEVGSG